MDLASSSDDALFAEAGERWRDLGAAQKRFLDVLREIDSRGAWELDGAECMLHWMGFTFGLSCFRSERLLRVAEQLPTLPRVSQALQEGELSIFKVEELVRFATPEEEDALVLWASGVTSGAIKEEADRRHKAQESRASTDDEDRCLLWRKSEDGGSLEMFAHLPAVEGELVRKAIDRMADRLPALTGDPVPTQAWASREQLRADALVALAMQGSSEGIAGSSPQLLVHAPVDLMLDVATGQDPEGAAWIDGGPLVHPKTLERLLCGSDVKTVIEDATGTAITEVRGPRAPSPKMARQLRYRDRRCVFPNCGHSRFVNAHHVLWWSQGGKTELDNLVLLCTMHHKLVHEHGWSLDRDANSGQVRWFRPDGTGYRAGPRAA